jgi:hypothetical protein
MRTLILWSMLILSAPVLPAESLRGAPQALAGPWRGALIKTDASTPVLFHFSAGDGGYRGFYWGSALTQIPLAHVQLGRAVHFEIPGMAVFDGVASGDVMEGTFRDESGGGSFRLQKQPDWDDPLNAP